MHVIPEWDVIQHDTSGPDTCICGPEVEAITETISNGLGQFVREVVVGVEITHHALQPEADPCQ